MLHLAQIALRILSIFLIYRSLEFGISQILYAFYSTQMLGQTPNLGMDDETRRMMQIYFLSSITAILVPMGLAVGLWFLAPWLSRLVANTDEEASPPINPRFWRDTIILGGAILILGVAGASLPKMAFDYRMEKRDPTMSPMESKVYPDVLQFLGKVLVGGALLLSVKNRFWSAPDRASALPD